MAVQLKCAWCGAQLADGGVSFFLFSCGDLACALHVMNPFCVSHDNYSLVAEVDSDAICIELLSSMNRLWQSQRSNWVGFAPAIYEKLEGMLKDYLNSLALECRQAMNLSEVYATPTVSKQCTLCSADISNEPQICQHCVTRALVPQKSDSECQCTACDADMNLEEHVCKDCHSAITLNKITDALQRKQCSCEDCGKKYQPGDHLCVDCERKKRPRSENHTQTQPFEEEKPCRKCRKVIPLEDFLCYSCSEAQLKSTINCKHCHSNLLHESAACNQCYENLSHKLSQNQTISCLDCGTAFAKGNLICQECSERRFQSYLEDVTCKVCDSPYESGDYLCTLCHNKETSTLNTKPTCKQCNKFFEKTNQTCPRCAAENIEKAREEIKCSKCNEHSTDVACMDCYDKQTPPLKEPCKCGNCQREFLPEQHICEACKYPIEKPQVPSRPLVPSAVTMNPIPASSAQEKVDINPARDISKSKRVDRPQSSLNIEEGVKKCNDGRQRSACKPSIQTPPSKAASKMCLNCNNPLSSPGQECQICKSSPKKALNHHQIRPRSAIEKAQLAPAKDYAPVARLHVNPQTAFQSKPKVPSQPEQQAPLRSSPGYGDIQSKKAPVSASVVQCAKCGEEHGTAMCPKMKKIQVGHLIPRGKSANVRTRPNKK